VTFGDEVYVTLDGDDFVPRIVVGVLHYADKDEIVMVATETTIGMPISTGWLKPTGNTNEMAALELRERYLARFGRHWLKEL
jgi:hypothetical protein